jgi:hypothetical protein
MLLFTTKYFGSVIDKTASAYYLVCRRHYTEPRGALGRGWRHETNAWQVLAAGIHP